MPLAAFWFKCTSIVTIWLLAVVGGLLPLRVGGMKKCTSSMLNLMAGGVFFAASIVHMLPDAAKNKALQCFWCNKVEYEEFLLDSHVEMFPWPYVLFGFGFSIIYVLETFAQSFLSTCDQGACERSHLLVLPETKVTEGQALHDGKAVTIVVFLSLSFHSIMEGMGIGSQTKPTWDIFLAIVAHKSLAAFALGMKLIAHRPTKIRYVISIFSFSIMTPIGIILGWAIVSSDSPDKSFHSGVCTAIAGGTFLYISVMEMVPREMAIPEDQGRKVLSFLAGFIVFSILAKWT